MDQAISERMLDNKSFPQNEQTMDFQGGKKSKAPKQRVKYGCREYVLHEGPRGGKYVVVKGKKVYMK